MIAGEMVTLNQLQVEGFLATHMVAQAVLITAAITSTALVGGIASEAAMGL